MLSWLIGTALALASSPLEVHSAVQKHASLRAIEHGPVVPESAYAKVDLGKIQTGLEFVEGVSAARAWGVAVMDAPLDAVWSSLYDIENHPARLGNVSQSHVLSTAGPERVVFQRIDLPIVSDRRWVVRTRDNLALERATGGQVRELTAQSLEQDPPPALAAAAAGAIPIAFSKTGWLVMAHGDRTVVEYWVWTDPGGRIPAGLASRFAPGAIRSMLNKLESDAKSR